jgi:DASH complex subunit ASK1
METERPAGTQRLQLEPSTPGRAPYLPDISMTDSSPIKVPTTGKKAPVAKDPVLHHMLDKTYRIAATPHTAQKHKAVGGFTPGTARRGAPSLAKWDIDSSPELSPAPQLRANLFRSPVKGPRTPGVSVQTPGKRKQMFSATKTKGIFDSDSEEDEDDLGFSPPKTMQFHIPQSRLLQTPGKLIRVVLIFHTNWFCSARGQQEDR